MDWALIPEVALYRTYGPDLSGPPLQGSSVTAPGVANTKGSWSVLVTAAQQTGTWDGFFLVVHQIGGTNSEDALIDIAFSNGTNRAIIVENFLYSQIGTNYQTRVARFNIALPLNSRIDGRMQISNATTETLFVYVYPFTHGFIGPASLTRSTTYGANTADSGGTNVDPGGTAHTKGVWSELAASTLHDIRELLFVFGNQVNTAATDASWLIDIGAGPAGQESVIIKDLIVAIDSNGDSIQPTVLGPYPIALPAGVRLAARAQCSITDATDRLFDIIAYGVN